LTTGPKSGRQGRPGWYTDGLSEPGERKEVGALAYCPECDAEIEGEPFEFEEGEVIECPECGCELEVTSTSPLEFELVESDWGADDEEEWD
jgi:lysine biosynthesis protein LysW